MDKRSSVRGAVAACGCGSIHPRDRRAAEEPGARELVDAARQLPGLDVQPAQPDQHQQRQAPGPGVELCDRRQFRPRGAADRQRRRHVRRHALRSAARARRQDRRSAVALPARAARRLRRPAQHQARRRPVRRQGLHDRAGRRAGRARRQDRRGRLGERAGRRLAAGLLHDHGAADRERQGHGRGVRRRVRRARLHRGVRCRERQAGVEDLHRPRSGRARSRHLGGRHLAEGRRLGLDDRHLRSREQSHLLGHRQRLALVRRSAARRQSLHLIDGGDRPRQRQDQGPLPVPLERLLGLGRDERADGGRLREGRSGRQRADQAVA